MKNLLLGIIAINLTFISINLTLRSIEPVYAEFTYSGNNFNECMGLANLEIELPSRVEARNLCGEKFNLYTHRDAMEMEAQLKRLDDRISNLDTVIQTERLENKNYNYGDDFTQNVKRIVETCEVVTSRVISAEIPGANMSIGGRNKGKIDCN